MRSSIKRQKIGHAVGDRRIGGDRAFFAGPACKTGFRRALECLFGFRNDIPKNVEFFRDWPAGRER